MALANALNISSQGFTVLNTTTGAFTGVSLTPSTGISITNQDGTGGNPVFSVDGSVVGKTITGNDLTALSRTAGNWNIFGNNTALNGFSGWSTGSASTLKVNSFSPVKWYVNTTSGLGTHTTLASAMAAASAGDTIVLQTSVTENVTITPGVNIAAFSSASLNTVSITGTLTMTAAGTSTISGVTLITNSAALLAVTGSAASVLNLNNCYLNCSNNTGITFSSSSASARININSCLGDLGTTGIGLFTHSSAGKIEIKWSKFTNGGGSSTASTCSAGIFDTYHSLYAFPITCSSTSGTTWEHCLFSTVAQNVIAATLNGSTHSCKWCRFDSGTASAVTIGSATAYMEHCTVSSSNTNAVTGAGTLNLGPISFDGSSSVINTSTVTSLVESVGQLKLNTVLSHSYGGTDVTSPGANGNVLTSNGTNWTSAAPAGGLSPIFQAYLSANQSNVTGDGTVYTIPFNSVSTNTGSAYNTGTFTFTAPSTGTYLFTGCVYLVEGASFVGMTQANITLVATVATFTLYTVNPATMNGNATLVLPFSTIIPMTSGDTAQLKVGVGVGTKTVLVGGTQGLSGFAGFKIG